MRDWTRVGRYVRHRRHDELGLTQPDVTARGGPSVPTIRNIEGGKKPAYHPRILASLEDVLGWERGSCLAIGDGKEPRLKVAVELGKLLVDRRLWLGGLDRDLWCAQQEPRLDPQLAYDIEHGLHSDYSLRQLGQLTQAYRLRRGAIRSYLAGQVTALAVDDHAPASPASRETAGQSQLQHLAKTGMDAPPTGWTRSLPRWKPTPASRSSGTGRKRSTGGRWPPPGSPRRISPRTRPGGGCGTLRLV